MLNCMGSSMTFSRDLSCNVYFLKIGRAKEYIAGQSDFLLTVVNTVQVGHPTMNSSDIGEPCRILNVNIDSTSVQIS